MKYSVFGGYKYRVENRLVDYGFSYHLGQLRYRSENTIEIYKISIVFCGALYLYADHPAICFLPQAVAKSIFCW